MKSLILLCILTISCAVLCFAEDETLTITTYYPSPYGVYRNLRLNPGNEPGASDGLDRGVMYFDQDLDKIRYYNNSGWVNLTDGGGGGVWTENSVANSVYLVNPNRRVGIGTNTPSQALEVSGSIRTSEAIVVGNSNAAIDGAIRFNGTGFEGYYSGEWHPFNTTSGGIGPGSLAGSGSFTLIYDGRPDPFTCGATTAPAVCGLPVASNWMDTCRCEAGWQAYNRDCGPIAYIPGGNYCKWICQKLP